QRALRRDPFQKPIGKLHDQRGVSTTRRKCWSLVGCRKTRFPEPCVGGTAGTQRGKILSSSSPHSGIRSEARLKPDRYSAWNELRQQGSLHRRHETFQRWKTPRPVKQSPAGH